MDSNEMEHKPAILNKRMVIIASYNSTMVILSSSDGLTGIAQQPLRRHKKPLRRRKNFHTVSRLVLRNKSRYNGNIVIIFNVIGYRFLLRSACI